MIFESTIHRAAVLIKSLPQHQAGEVMSRLDAQDLRSVFGKIRSLGDVTQQQRQLAIKKFLDEAVKQQSADTRREKALNRNRSDSGPFDFLIAVADSIRFQVLAVEHPKNVATVLSFLPTRAASQTLNQFEPECRVAVLRRLCQNTTVDRQEIARLSQQLKTRLNRLLSAGRFQTAGIAVASRLLSCSDLETQQVLMDCLDQDDPELAGELRDNVFTFEDLQRFSGAEMKRILERADTAMWAPALKNASAAVRSKVLQSMAAGPRRILNGEIQNLQETNARAVDDARSGILSTCLNLADRQLIRLPTRRVTESN